MVIFKTGKVDSSQCDVISRSWEGHFFPTHVPYLLNSFPQSSHFMKYQVDNVSSLPYFLRFMLQDLAKILISTFKIFVQKVLKCRYSQEEMSPTDTLMNLVSLERIVE